MLSLNVLALHPAVLHAQDFKIEVMRWQWHLVSAACALGSCRNHKNVARKLVEQSSAVVALV